MPEWAVGQKPSSRNHFGATAGIAASVPLEVFLYASKALHNSVSAGLLETILGIPFIVSDKRKTLGSPY
jgi:hypothetical protein